MFILHVGLALEKNEQHETTIKNLTGSVIGFYA